MAAMAVAGVSIWSSIGGLSGLKAAWPALAQEPSSPKSQAAAKPQKPASPEAGTPGRPIGEEELAFWSKVAIFKAGPDRPRPIVVIKRGRQPDSGDELGLYQGLLDRELVRQGLLLTAREELGALTRDVPIGDSDVPGTPDVTFRIGSRFRKSYPPDPADPPRGRITIVQGEGPDRRVLWSREFECEMIIGPLYPQLVAQVEVFSRHGFRQVLEDLGLKRTEPAPSHKGESELPAAIRERLGRPVETEQFAAIRALHQAIREKGEDSTLLIALAEAYANLGTLAESQWTADYLAFQARGLLYAQRAVVRDHDAPSSLRGQAYVEAIAGLYRQAVGDLNAAGRADGGKGADDRVALVRAFTASDAPALEQLARDHPDDPWPPYFRFLTLLRSSGYFSTTDRNCRHELLAASQPILEQVPDCYRVLAGLIQMEGVASLHATTMLGYTIYPQKLPERLANVPDLPASVLEPAPDDAEPAEVGFRRRLAAAAADDTADVTWGVLARQLREIRFAQIGYRLYFLARQLAVPANDFADEALPLVADHPNRDYVASFTGRYNQTATLKSLANLDLADLQWKARSIAFRFEALDPPTFQRLHGLIWSHVVLGSVPGQITYASGVTDSGRAAAAHNLLKYHPGSPLGRGALIESNWEEAKPSVEAWAKDHGGQDTLVLAELGFHALKVGDLDEAERLIKKAMDQSPDGWIFEGLAGVYMQRGDVDGYIAAATEFLKTRDLALDHAQITSDLSKYLMARGEYEKARPFAEISAQSWAAWAMLNAARCAEEMKDWEGAELWISRTAERYASQWLDWYAWCLRTGHGDRRAAARLVESQLAQGRPLRSADERVPVAVVLLNDNQAEQARKILAPTFNQNHDTVFGTLLALACDLEGNTEARDAVMKQVAEEPNPSGPVTAQLLGILGSWLAKGEESPLDLDRIEKLLSEGNPDRRPNTAVIVGLFLNRHGKTDAALAYLKEGDDDRTYLWFRFLARNALQDRGITLDPIPAS